MQLESGTRLGPYRIDSRIGAGGMGEVYRAIDTRLDRSVAVKILPAALSGNSSYRERFEREAKTISSVSHPNICTLFDVGHDSGVSYLVMEYLQGETLADRIAHGPLPLAETLRIGEAIAVALSHAHRHGIVHRDLKPGNVMLTKGGVKLLDFGLARLQVAIAADAATHVLPSTGQQALTEEGTIVGTFHYMAPEVLEGHAAGTGSDLFALGAVLYEMVTGRRAFAGASRASVIAAIMERDPEPIAALAPASLDRLIRACLQKDPERRIESAHDVALELRWIAEGAEPVAIERRRAMVLPWILAALALAGAGITAMMARRGDPPRAAVNLSLLAPAGYRMESAAVSPDGERVAFVASNETNQRLFVQKLDETTPRMFDVDPAGGKPFWSPDGKWIAFFGWKGLLKVPSGGGPVETIGAANYGGGGAWNRDGTILFLSQWKRGLERVPAAGGTPVPVTTLDGKRRESAHAWPAFLPDGRRFLYLSTGLPSVPNRIMLGSLEGGTPREVMTADGFAGYDEPYLLFVRSGSIYAVRFDAEQAKPLGEPQRIVENVQFSGTWAHAFSTVSTNGVLLYPPLMTEKRRLVWYDRGGVRGATAVEDDDIGRFSLSSDGLRVAYEKTQPEHGGTSLVLADLARGTRTVISDARGDHNNPVWLPGDHEIAFASAREGMYDIFAMRAEGGAPARRMWTSEIDKDPLSVSPDGRDLIVKKFGSGFDLWLVPLAEGEPRPLLEASTSEDDAEISPDGYWLLVVSTSPTSRELYLRPLAGGRITQLTSTGVERPRWTRSGDAILFLTPDSTLMEVRVTGKGAAANFDMARTIARLPRGTFGLAIAPDGRLLMNERADETPAPSTYRALVGWRARIEK
ncbi:MAG: protein kinase [Acidobacteriota bacterium]|nr:protein kinase [Acidobacteriota bacterium]